MSNYDVANLTLSMYPNNKIILDDDGNPHVFVYIPKFRLCDVLDTKDESVHPAFIIDGKEVDGVYIAKYLSSNHNEKPYSLPNMDPANSRNFDWFVNNSASLGDGFHEMTLAEHAAVSLWCKKNGFMPKGNNNYGKDLTESVITAVPSPNVNDNGKTARTLTGTGPKSWFHNNDLSGIADLNGNVLEMVGGVRFVFGELQILPNNNGADTENSQSATSSLWKAVNAKTGALMTPENSTSDTITSTYSHTTSLKLAYVSGVWTWTNVLTSDTTTTGAGGNFGTFTADSNVCDAAKLLLRSLQLLPEDGSAAADYDDDGSWIRNDLSECVVYVGGRWYYGGRAGAFYLSADYGRSSADWAVGGRLAYRKKEDQ